ncbi:MAG: hypothetical protein IPH16_13930 [Haliscomenobacter sp.]|nr:hypothetical protein [Haliscomenobacter sp.]
MNTTYQIMTINEIPEDLLFEGYYWYSNEQSPMIITGKPIQKSWFTEIPFVIEANFLQERSKSAFRSGTEMAFIIWLN